MREIDFYSEDYFPDEDPPEIVDVISNLLVTRWNLVLDRYSFRMNDSNLDSQPTLTNQLDGLNSQAVRELDYDTYREAIKRPPRRYHHDKG